MKALMSRARESLNQQPVGERSSYEFKTDRNTTCGNPHSVTDDRVSYSSIDQQKIEKQASSKGVLFNSF